jgi:glycosyltransferase involved in cell wall biosynthesis
MSLVLQTIYAFAADKRTKMTTLLSPTIQRQQRDTTLGRTLSVVIPVFNEEENVDIVCSKVIAVMERLGHPWEIIFIDDGSTDTSYEKLLHLAHTRSNIKVVRFVRNFGQTAALAAGIDYARGDIIIPMDADMQNDPRDIEKLLDKLDEGYDVVSGWRKDRKDELVTRLVPSWIANKLISVISGVKLHDYGCSLKAYRRDILKHVKLYGEMHRFVPIYASWEGAKVAEIPVNHYPRWFGKSKYGLSRTFKVILDLLTVKFLSTYLTKPIYVFGTAGFLCLALSMAAFVWMVVLKYCYDTTFIETPLPVLITMLFVVGIQLVLMGLLAEILMRTYHEAQDKKIYKIKSIVNTEQDFLHATDHTE